jgi:tetratricopeptide (TPR) repeat protein
MEERTLPEGVFDLSGMLESDPEGLVEMMNELIRENPDSPHYHWDRHLAWMALGDPWRALDDINKSIKFGTDPWTYMWRGEVYRYLGDYVAALEDYARIEAEGLLSSDTVGNWLLCQADCHARLGDEAAALACCARMPDDFVNTDMKNAPAGDKEDIAAELRRLAAEARRMRM